ncbi:DUF1707 domain-containing protein [Streptomyces sp. NBC_01239]|uniref:DUF1707 SHOCT-like domain-containing protein n=1 Tax=Streptomyces sp. NBC_01239 TaxID=2903792 RepID=UPI002254136E|nr:DUF1707 domain-containing protein [Streptomyces sp. NBC_01239]MCX4809542.1 DUF1707 domain-containing protein [Streptomyces sp. NBC_01239]
MSGELMGTTELRASHADRDRVVDVLTSAAGDGRLTSEELDERVEAALTARTLGELAVLTADLPVPAGAVAAEVKDVARIEQRGGSARRGDGWVVPRRLEIVSHLGDVTLDFTQAVITEDTLRIDLDMHLGKLVLLIRPGIVVDTDSLVTGYGKIKTRGPAGTGVPVDLRIEIAGQLGFGKVLVRRKR